MDIKVVPIKSIKPYENNPRNNDDAVEAVANSIKEFGWQQPIVVDKDNVIIVGHTRYKAAKKLKLDEVPITVADKLTPEQVKAYRLADNKVGELADWDDELLNSELLEINDLDMSDFGFDEISDDIFTDDDTPAQEDDFEEEVPEEPKSKQGQIYKLGNHRLMCGDSTSSEDVASLLIACEQNGRNAYLREYDPRYVDVIIDRWEKFTGKKAELIKG